MCARDRGLPSRRKMRHDRHFVEELARRTGEGIGRMIPVTSIASNDDQPRTSLGNLSDLVTSISTHGILEPLLVRRRELGGYELVSGERRFHAALQAGLEEVPCIELEVTDHHALEIALIENLQRQDLSAFEEAEGFSTLADKYGYTHSQIAKAIGRSRVTVTEALALLKIPPDLRDVCRHADITAKGMLLQIARAGSSQDMAKLIQEIVENRLDRQSLRELRKEANGVPSTASPNHTKEGNQASRRSRPLTLRVEDPESAVKLSVSIRGLDDDGRVTPEPPSRDQIVAALERLLVHIKEQGAEDLFGKS